MRCPRAAVSRVGRCGLHRDIGGNTGGDPELDLVLHGRPMHDEKVSGIGAGHEHDAGAPGFKQILRAQFQRHRIVAEAWRNCVHLSPVAACSVPLDQILRRDLLNQRAFQQRRIAARNCVNPSATLKVGS